MIYTVTLNPSLDYIVDVKDFHIGEINRTKREGILPGGKGINVSIMLKELGAESVATGYLAGFTGEEIRCLLSEYGLTEKFLFLKDGFSRINVKLRGAQETEINGAGPFVSDEEKKALLRCLEQKVSCGDTLVLSGSAPHSLPSHIYGEIIRSVYEKNVRIVADVAGNLLTEILSYRPFLIKPNHHELGELFGVCVRSADEAVFYARKLCERGAENVMVSLAGDGAVLVTEDSVYYAQAPKGAVVNSVGAGDSAVAGFLAGFLKTGDFAQALSLAVAAGSATAFSEGIAKGEAVLLLREQVNIVKRENVRLRDDC